MDSGSVFFLLAIIVVVLLFITQPFYRKEAEVVKKEKLPSPRGHLEDEYQSVLKNIRELTGDYEQGKLSESDYNTQRALLEDQGIHLLEEQEKARKPAAKAKQGDHHEIEEMIHDRRKIRQEQTAGFCPKCGKPVQKSDQFCPSCGEPTHLYL